jgi:hAT family C-terminal dimerisation region
MQPNMNELVSYCLRSMEPDNIDILGCWKRNETTYPTLTMMAHDIFVVLVSTAPFESCFSSTNMILQLNATDWVQRHSNDSFAWKISLMQNNVINMHL